VIAVKKIKDGSRIGLESKSLRQRWLAATTVRAGHAGFKMTFTFAER
jgi:hypothetical protein